MASIIFIFSFCLYWFRLPQSLNINTDYGKDIYNVAKIASGNQTLLGPALSAGIFAGPYYYYLMLPVYFLSGGNPYSIALTGVILFSACQVFLFWLLCSWYPLSKASLATVMIGISPLYVLTAREPANGLMYVPLLMVFCALIYQFDRFSVLLVIILGLLSGLILNFDTVSLIAVLPLSIYLLFKLKLKKSLLFILGLVSTYLPLILFEIKNNFIIIRGLIVNHNYMTFVNNNSVVGSVSGNSNFWLNLPIISVRSESLLSLSPIVALIIIIFFTIKKKPRGFNPVISYISLATFILTVVLVRYKLEIHYLFPLSVILLFTLIRLGLSFKKSGLLFFLGLIFIIGFPFQTYQPTSRPFSFFEKPVEYLINNQLVSPYTPFNVMAITDSHIYVPIGNEYRFFFFKKGYPPLNEYQYPQSKVLFIFSQIGDYPVQNLNNWEIDQFGKQFLFNSHTYRVDDTYIYKIEK